MIAAALLERLLLFYARHFPLRTGKLRLVDSLWRPAAAGRGTMRHARLRYGGFAMTCDIREMLQRQFYFFGTYLLEEEMLECWTAAARSASVVFDVGANAGIFSLAALAASPGATVHAFEPTSEIAQRLRATAAMNGLDTLMVHEAAVAGADGRAWLCRWRGGSGQNEGMNYIVTIPSGTEPVRTVSLDSFCRTRGIDHIDLMKVDVQGQEPLVLAGARELLRTRAIRLLFLELGWGASNTVDPATQSLSMLTEAGYEFSRPHLPFAWRPAGDWLHGLHDIAARPAFRPQTVSRS